MPARPSTPCRGCGTRIAPGAREGRCPACLRDDDARRWARNPNRDAAYRKLRDSIELPVECAICGQPITHRGHDADALTLDHVTPRAHGGTNHPAGLRPAHKRCNSARGARSTT